MIIIYFFLQMDYNKRGCVYRFVRKPFVLPFQPEEQIPVTFDALSTIAYKLYIERTWINRTINVDCIPHGCEDKQRRQGMAPPHQQSCLLFYVLVILLHKETTSIPTQLKMISEGKSGDTNERLQEYYSAASTNFGTAATMELYQRGPTSKGMWADLQQCTMDSDKKELAERRCVNVTEIFQWW